MTLAVVAVSAVLAYATYRLIELPVRSLVTNRGWRPVVVAAPLAAAGCAGIAVFLAAGLPGRLPVEIQRLTTVAFDHHTAYRESRCFLQPWQGLRAFKPDCVDPGKGKLLLLWGDSHAAHLYPGLRTAARERSFRIAQLTASACPPLLDHRSSRRPKCHAINAGVLAKARELRPDSVVLSARWEEYRDLGDLTRTVTELRRVGVEQIVVVGPSPSWELGLPRRSTTKSSARTSPLSDALKQHPSSEQARVDRELRQLSRSLGVTYVAPLECSATSTAAWPGSRTRSTSSRSGIQATSRPPARPTSSPRSPTNSCAASTVLASGRVVDETGLRQVESDSRSVHDRSGSGRERRRPDTACADGNPDRRDPSGADPVLALAPVRKLELDRQRSRAARRREVELEPSLQLAAGVLGPDADLAFARESAVKYRPVIVS